MTTTQYTNSLAQIKRVNENLQNVYFSNGYGDVSNPQQKKNKKKQSANSSHSSLNNFSNDASVMSMNNMSNICIG